MRIFLTIAVAILAGAGFAQTVATSADQSSTLTDEEVAIQWEKLMIVTSGDTEADALDHLRSYGMGENGAKALWAFRARAEAEMQSMFKQSHVDLCAKKEELREGGPEMLAQLIEEQRGRAATARRHLLAEANSLLSPADQERLEYLYTSDHGPKVSLTDSSLAARARDGRLPVERAIANACARANNKLGE
jgi:hypothetical protein